MMVKRLVAAFGGQLRVGQASEGAEGPSGALVELVLRTDREAPPISSQVGAVTADYTHIMCVHVCACVCVRVCMCAGVCAYVRACACVILVKHCVRVVHAGASG